jgi:DNA-binding NarL/FixJ family response regulator
VLGSEPDMEVVGEAITGKEAVERATEVRPDVILMDIQMPDLNGIAATRRILEVAPDIGVVVLTMFEDDDSVFSAMRAGARGYVLKGAKPAEILKVLRPWRVGRPTSGRRSPDASWFSSPNPNRLPLKTSFPSSASGRSRSSISSPRATLTQRSLRAST